MENIKICVWDWRSYNEGRSNYKWFNLPQDDAELENHLDTMEDSGLEEPFICDTDGHGGFISEYTPIKDVMELALEIGGSKDAFTENWAEDRYNDYFNVIPMEELEDYLERFTPIEIFSLMDRGDFYWSHDWFIDDTYGIRSVSDYDMEEAFNEAFENACRNFLRNI